MSDPDAPNGEGAESTFNEAAHQPSETPKPAACLSCGARAVGGFCPNCGQKNDDLRRSIFLLARDFVEDTFSFDSRMWRTLGSLAAKPGLVPRAYAHGRRSRYTPPVRLFLVVSFLFFLALGVTDTMFVAVHVKAPDPNSIGRIDLTRDKKQSESPTEASAYPTETQCNLKVSLKFFVQPHEIESNLDLWADCMEKVKRATEEGLAKAQAAEADAVSVEEAEEVSELVLGLAGGMSKAVENPRAFNAAFNAWLPRVLLLMTPVAALILSIFIRGRDALYFDHLVLAFYSHAIGFAAVGAAIVLARAGAPWMVFVAALFLAVYFVRSLKRAYGRGWVKTVWTAFAGAMLYLITLFLIVLAIVLGLILQG